MILDMDTLCQVEEEVEVEMRTGRSNARKRKMRVSGLRKTDGIDVGVF